MKYVRCEGHCKYPAYDKEEVDNLLSNKIDKGDFYTKEEVDSKIKNIYSGTTDPEASLGNDGDIYLKYE